MAFQELAFRQLSTETKVLWRNCYFYHHDFIFFGTFYLYFVQNSQKILPILRRVTLQATGEEKYETGCTKVKQAYG